MTTTTPRTTPSTSARDRSTPTAPGRRGPAAGRTTLRLEHTRELLTLLPHQLGFQPQDSVVLVALRPPGRSVGLMARLDLADVLAPEGPVLVAGAVAHLEADGAREVVVVVYGDDPDPRDPGRGLRARPGADPVRAAEVARHAAALLGPVTVWYVGRGRYLGLDCRDRGCCPPGGRPLAELTGGELAGQLVARGPVAPSRAEVGVIRPAAPGPRRGAAAARSRWLDSLLRTHDPAGVRLWRQRSLDGWRQALATLHQDPGATVRAAVLGRVEAGLLDPVVRDAVVLTLVGADADLPDALVRAAPDGSGPSVAARVHDTDDPLADADPDGCPEPESAVERAGEALARDTDDGSDGGGARDGAQVDGDHPDHDHLDGDGGDRADPDRADAADPADPADPAGADRGARGDRADPESDDRDDCDDPDRDEERRRPGARGGPASDRARSVSGRVRDALDLMVDPVSGREPDDALVDAARTVLEHVVAHGRRERQAPALTLLALLAWWGGDAVRASVLVERALDQDPGHRLAELLDRALGYGLPPGWLRRRC
jgi:hypothetical protein